MVTTEQIKELRNKTSVSIAQCKKALEEAGGDLDKAMEVLKKQGAEMADKKSDRDLKAGAVSSYIHSNGQIGVLIEVQSETDFVSQNQEFKELADDVAMHIAASDPADVAELLEQPFIKNPSQTVDDLIKEKIQKFGERIEVSRFTKFSL